jgi:very-short-patch-repair endonuclease
MSRDRNDYAKNASKLHRAIGNALNDSNSFFFNYKIEQEVSVSAVNSSYKSNREKFDWVCWDLKFVIEAHGKQHFIPQSFAYSDQSQKNKFKKIQEYDEKKKQAAIEAGFTYIMIPYTEVDNISASYIQTLYLQNLNHHQVKLEKLDCVNTKKKSSSFYYDKERAREIRKEQYKKQKEWRKNHVKKHN